MEFILSEMLQDQIQNSRSNFIRLTSARLAESWQTEYLRTMSFNNTASLITLVVRVQFPPVPREKHTP